MNTSRIPEFSDKSFNGMQNWFATMSVRELLFHPDDLPETISGIATGEPTFSATECVEVSAVLNEMIAQHGDKVYEAAYPVFMKRMGISPDA